jgi:mitogen-activated protein kinase kinase kinase 7
MTNSRGSASWMAPEVFASQTYTEKCDVFSWGIILWEVLARRKPFEELNGPSFAIMWAVHGGKRPPLLQKCPEKLESLMTSCWHMESVLRPSMSEVHDVMETYMNFCPRANEPIIVPEVFETTPAHLMGSVLATKMPNNAIFTEPAFLSDTNLDYLNYDTTSRMIPNSVPLNLSAAISRERLDSELYVNTDDKPVDVTRRRSAEPALTPSSSFVKGHKRSGSHGSSNERNDDSRSTNDSGYPGLAKSKSYNDNSFLDDNSGPLVNSRKYTSMYEPKRPNSLNYPPTEDEYQDDEFNAHMALEPRLRPTAPDTSDEMSISIFKMHRQQAQEYLRARQEVMLLQERKNELESIDPNNPPDIQEEYQRVREEKEMLITYKNNLITQLHGLKRQMRQKEAIKDGDWVLVD